MRLLLRLPCQHAWCAGPSPLVGEAGAAPCIYAIASRFRTQALQQQHACEMAFAWQCSFALGAAAVTSGTRPLLWQVWADLCSLRRVRVRSAYAALGVECDHTCQIVSGKWIVEVKGQM